MGQESCILTIHTDYVTYSVTEGFFPLEAKEEKGAFLQEGGLFSLNVFALRGYLVKPHALFVMKFDNV